MSVPVTGREGICIMTGVLLIDAIVDVTQFWPNGESDADTVKLTLSDPENGFRFRASPGAPTVITHAFDNAGMFEKVKGKQEFKPLTRHGAITTPDDTRVERCVPLLCER